ncbi:hypothetical protein [Mammaliicoccus vitulinus]|uniref:hypothetical protein n=1 Tax=Mammaliicoccus vitulinus TaxID=71237 RepID=UPI001866CEED|nr:hypothetical protein [Mammaliicoccus vitulinus]
MLKTYYKDYQAYLRLIIDKQYMDSTSISSYGDEPTTSKTNVITDPVFNIVNKRISGNIVEDKLMKRITFINENSKCVTDDKLIIVMSLRIKGLACKDIARIIGVGRTRVQNMLHEIALKIYQNQKR